GLPAARKPAAEINLSEVVCAFRGAFADNGGDKFNFIFNGLFGLFTCDTLTHLEEIQLETPPTPHLDIPFMQYHISRYVIAIDHFRNQLFIFEHQLEDDDTQSGLEKIQYLIQNKNFPEYRFSLNGGEHSNMGDAYFKALVEKMKTH